jgi:hypothetical protein
MVFVPVPMSPLCMVFIPVPVSPLYMVFIFVTVPMLCCHSCISQDAVPIPMSPLYMVFIFVTCTSLFGVVPCNHETSLAHWLSYPNLYLYPYPYLVPHVCCVLCRSCTLYPCAVHYAYYGRHVTVLGHVVTCTLVQHLPLGMWLVTELILYSGHFPKQFHPTLSQPPPSIKYQMVAFPSIPVFSHWVLDGENFDAPKTNLG